MKNTQILTWFSVTVMSASIALTGACSHTQVEEGRQTDRTPGVVMSDTMASDGSVAEAESESRPGYETGQDEPHVTGEGYTPENYAQENYAQENEVLPQEPLFVKKEEVKKEEVKEEAKEGVQELADEAVQEGGASTLGNIPDNGIVRFSFDESTLDPERVNSLFEHIEYLTENPEQNVVIIGHADKQGDAQYNRLLSIKRAQVIASALVEGGVQVSQINLVSMGAEEPVSAESSDEDNRRAEIVYEVESVFDVQQTAMFKEQ